MKENKNKTIHYYHQIRRFLSGTMSDAEEKSFVQKLESDIEFKRMAVAEAMLSKSYSIQQEKKNKVIQNKTEK